MRGLMGAARQVGGNVGRGLSGAMDSYNANVDPTAGMLMGLNLLANKRSTGAGNSPLLAAMPGLTQALMLNDQRMGQKREREAESAAFDDFLSADPSRASRYQGFGGTKAGRQAAMGAELDRMGQGPQYQEFAGKLYQVWPDGRRELVETDPLYGALPPGAGATPSPFDKALVGANVDQLKSTREIANAARSRLDNINRAEAALDAGAPTGGLSGSRATLGRLLPDIAGHLPMVPRDSESVALDEFNRALSAITLDDVGKMKGGLSEKELEFVRSATLNADATPESNRQSLAVARAVSQRQIAYAEAYENFMQATDGMGSEAQFQEYWTQQVLPRLPQIGGGGSGSGSQGQAQTLDPLNIRP